MKTCHPLELNARPQWLFSSPMILVLIGLWKRCNETVLSHSRVFSTRSLTDGSGCDHVTDFRAGPDGIYCRSWQIWLLYHNKASWSTQSPYRELPFRVFCNGWWLLYFVRACINYRFRKCVVEGYWPLEGYEDVLLAWQESSINYIVLMQWMPWQNSVQSIFYGVQNKLQWNGL